MRRSVGLIAVATLVGAGLTTPPAQAASSQPSTDHRAPSAQHSAQHAGHHTGQQHPAHRWKGYTPPPIRWGTCPTASLQKAGASCGMVTVPLDYAHPHGTKIQLAVSRVLHNTSDAAAQGVMLVNPGGPGGSGLEYSRLGPAVPEGGGDPYDWIGFDPRGVGDSVPSLTCDGDYNAPGRPAYDPEAGTKRFWLAKTAAYSRDCKTSAAAEILRHDHTTDWVADMESIRKALGVKKINYYGFSYGTYLGQVYATLHPDRVRRFVFDGVVDPRDIWYQANLAQNKQFDRNIDTYFDWVADHNAAYGLGTDGRAVRALYYKVLDDLTYDPDPNFGAADWADSFQSAAYYVYNWDDLAHVLVAAAHGDLGPAKAWYDDPTGPGADNEYASYLAVSCTDAPWPSWRTQERDAYRIASFAPFLTWGNTWFNAPCNTWPAPASTPVHVDGRRVPPILLIEETNDAATPWPGAIEVRKRFPGARLIEGVGGTTHAGSLSGVSCTDDRIAAYLLHGTLDPRKPGNNRSDVQCPPVPPPAATPVTATAAGVAPSVGSSHGDRLGSLRDLLMSTGIGGL